MLSPSPAQKNLSEEDSSGSEPETDRFGFILTNGSTAGSFGPSPELVRQREAKWINIIGQWDRILLKKSSKVKVQCQKGIPASLRAKCWPLLCGATDKMKQYDKLYKVLDSQPGLQSWVEVIERDLDRQFPFHEMFQSKDGHGQRGLFRVLKAYTQYQPEEGYCQAQGPVAAVLLMNMPAEEAFWCLVQISEQYLPGYYSPLLEGVLFDASMLLWVLKKTCPAAHKHLQQHGVEPLMFATDWLMCLFTRHLPFNTLLRVWDLFFCYGVRVLLQVAVVLVRRVLGRADQRKLCQGQMETLERLRGVKEEVPEEDDDFIGEVCSVPLSTKDLEKQTEKMLEKWKKDRPSSTFDPRGRCHGYRMAWASACQSKLERERREREKGNLSVPLARSSSTLSLSPSMLHKRWRKEGKANTGEREGSNRIVRHLSMGGKDDWRNWADLDFQKVQRVQEEESDALEEHRERQMEQKEYLSQERDKTQNMPVDYAEERVNEQTEKVETITEQEETRQECEIQKEETNQCSNQAQISENILQQTDRTSNCEEEVKLDSTSHSQDLDEQSQENMHEENTNEATEKCDIAAVAQNHDEILIETTADTNTPTEVEAHTCLDSSEKQNTQVDSKPEETAEIEKVRQIEMDTVTEAKEMSLDMKADTDAEASAEEDKNAATETETQQEEEELVTNSEDNNSLEEKHQRTESLVETEKIEESDLQTETDTEALEQTQEKEKGEIIETESEPFTNSVVESTTEETSSSLSENIKQEEDGDLLTDTEEKAETAASTDTIKEKNEGIIFEFTQEKEGIILIVHSEAQADSGARTHEEINPEQTSTEADINEEMVESEKEISTQAEEMNHTTEQDGSLVLSHSSEAQAPKQLTSQVATSPKAQNVQQMSPVEEEKNTETVEESRAGKDEVFITDVLAEDPPTGSNPPAQESPKNQSELLAQTSVLRSSCSSGDVCVRRSSTSRGSRLARRLSEDLFTTPQKSVQSQFIPEVKHTEVQPRAANQEHPSPDGKLSAEAAEDVPEQQNQQPQFDLPKRFDLFRKLRGDQPKPTKTKGAQKIQIPKILIQDFSNVTTGYPGEEEAEEKLSSRERRRRRRERERREKEEEKAKRKKEKELEKERERERRKPETRGKSFQVQKEKSSNDVAGPGKIDVQTLRYSASYADSYF
ncbi:uncharacterized protein tbc1d10c [Pholidichthys leucotaenia]